MNKKQRALLDAVRTFAGTPGHEHGFYTECGTGKPWHVGSVKSLARKGLVTVTKAVGENYVKACFLGYVDPHSVFFLSPVNERSV